MNWKTINRLLEMIKPYWYLLFMIVICSIVQVVLTMLGPILIGQAIDCMVGVNNVDFSQLINKIFLLFSTILGAGIAQWVGSVNTSKLSYAMVNDLRKAAMDKICKMPIKTIDSQSYGEFISRIIMDVDVVADGLLQGFSQLISGVLIIIGTLGFMFFINVTVALVVVLLTPISLIVAAIIAKKTYQRFTEQSKIRGELSGYFEEIVNNTAIVKAFSYEEQTLEKFAEINDHLYESGWRAQFYSALTNPTTRLVNAIIYAVVCSAGAIMVLQGRITVGMLSSFLTYANQYMKPFNEISAVVAELQAAIASATRVIEIIDSEIEPLDEQLLKLENVMGNVKLENVEFSYNPDKPFIKKFSIEATKGQTIAIVGPTGCGKTTLINLLMRFYNITNGAIYVDLTDTKLVTKSSLRQNFGMVLQDSWLFEGNVRDNIAYGKHDATLDEIIVAAKKAHIHHFIKLLPHGYDTILKDDEAMISEGQKQLLCIARIMLMEPPMLILDEATSNIDTRTEILVQRAFDAMMQGRTSFIIAHRLSTIRNADKILVMKDGAIIEQGTHDELIEAAGFYENLYNSQFKHT
jgi:ABC-type multidrug transport system, ATPase and permease components